MQYPNLSVSKLDDISKKYNNTPWYLWVANLIGTTLNMPQSLYLNALNAVTSMMKGEQITYHNNMSYRDYQREQTRKFGGKSIADFTDEMRTKGLAGNVAGNMIDFALELATDPGFMSFAAKTIQKSAANNVKVPSGNYVDDVVSNINKREQLLNTVKNDKLKNAVNEIYRPNATVGDGGLADAVRHELSTGNLVGGKSHITKATERITNLENIINKQNLNQSDLEIAQELLDDLKNSLGGK